jgi:hypothetical protein
MHGFLGKLVISSNALNSSPFSEKFFFYKKMFIINFLEVCLKSTPMLFKFAILKPHGLYAGAEARYITYMYIRHIKKIY